MRLISFDELEFTAVFLSGVPKISQFINQIFFGSIITWEKFREEQIILELVGVKTVSKNVCVLPDTYIYI